MVSQDSTNVAPARASRQHLTPCCASQVRCQSGGLDHIAHSQAEDSSRRWVHAHPWLFPALQRASGVYFSRRALTGGAEAGHASRVSHLSKYGGE